MLVSSTYGRTTLKKKNHVITCNLSLVFLLSLSFVPVMSDLTLSKEGYTKYLGIPKELSVRTGDDVVLTCSARSSEEPSYFWNKEVRHC